MNLRDAVELIAASQGPGRYICPKCCGGTDQEHSLSIRLDEAGGIHWRCFRASCGYYGRPGGYLIRTDDPFSGPRREPRHYTRPIAALTDAQAALINRKYGIDPSLVDGYNVQDDRFILAVYGPQWNNRRGCIAYSLSGAKPKSLTYNERPDEPFLHWASGTSPRLEIVIVEDWFSAEKVAEAGAIGVALMGTHIDQAIITEIASMADGPVYVALDRDAYTKTLLYLSKYREQFPRGLYAWSLKQDLKYESVERIKEALNGNTDFIGGTKRQGGV